MNTIMAHSTPTCSSSKVPSGSGHCPVRVAQVTELDPAAPHLCRRSSAKWVPPLSGSLAIIQGELACLAQLHRRGSESGAALITHQAVHGDEGSRATACHLQTQAGCCRFPNTNPSRLRNLVPHHKFTREFFNSVRHLLVLLLERLPRTERGQIAVPETVPGQRSLRDASEKGGILRVCQ